jgi:2-(3-amino-3-carboxypropyl)histidine synthase
MAVEKLSLDYTITVPQSKPLSKGEVLGCTAPKMPDQDLIIYLGDGRFHLEAIMIANPLLKAFRYDPYSKKFTREYYSHREMYDLRSFAITQSQSAKHVGLIMGTLGRQGSLKVVEYLERQLQIKNLEYSIILLSEITPQKLDLFQDIDCFIQVACPRLSIDWGYSFSKPLLSPYEACVLFGIAPKWDDSLEGNNYPMDFYSKDSLGPWTPNH